MKIDAKQLPAMYEWLRSASKSLSAAPPVERVRFQFRPTFRLFGWCHVHVGNIKRRTGAAATIVITAKNQDIHQMVETMAHEMCHLVQYEGEVMARGCMRSAHHGRKFKRLAKKVCEELHMNEHIF